MFYLLAAGVEIIGCVKQEGNHTLRKKARLQSDSGVIAVGGHSGVKDITLIPSKYFTSKVFGNFVVMYSLLLSVDYITTCKLGIFYLNIAIESKLYKTSVSKVDPEIVVEPNFVYPIEWDLKHVIDIQLFFVYKTNFFPTFNTIHNTRTKSVFTCIAAEVEGNSKVVSREKFYFIVEI